ncbi:hypothetical protein [Phenylobacterium sp.]|uniref:hypothetical protein n=1 Tax=Phenylobacterium sp. TaxID=1871053 RepID=UPI002737CAEE|nr:hypothetical protein [Phenylobacterium sp.]MDP3869136.1 hypothetical protein [Phenylobacterium sp.]
MSTTTHPLLFTWDGEAMWPRPAFRKEADRQFTVGETYRLGELAQRSHETHAHQFAWLNEAWKTLPERLAAEFPTAGHLRKRALIETGFHRETILDVGTHEAAVQVATTLRSKDEFAWIVVRGHVVVMREARSQSKSAMKPEDFQKSKQAILEWVSALLGVAPETLNRQTEAA